MAAKFNNAAHVYFEGEEAARGDRPSGVPGGCVRLPGALRRRCQDVQEVRTGGASHEHVHGPTHV